MKKISLILVFALILSVMPSFSVAAADAIIENSSFDTLELKNWSGKGGNFVLDKDNDALGAKNGKSYRAKYVGVNTDYRCENFKLTPGMEYILTYYAKSDKDEAFIFPMVGSTGGGWLNLDNMKTVPVSKGWKKYTTTFLYPTVLRGYETVEDAYLTIRLLTAGSTVWLDEVQIIDPSVVVEEKEEVLKLEEYVPYEYQNQGSKVSLSGFSDMLGHWAETTAVLMMNEKIASGVGDNNFLPEKKVTRAEFIKLLASSLAIENNEYSGIFSDVDEKSWYAETIQTAYDLGLIDSALIDGDKFYPDAPVTRQEACTIIRQYIDYINLGDKKSVDKFCDDADISEAHRDAVYSVMRRGVVSGFPDGSFKPKEILSRAEAIQLIRNILEHDGPMAVYVNADDGNDENIGTIDAPFKTVKRATQYVRENNKNMTHNLYVFIHEGEHFIEESIELNENDGGSNGHSVVYTSYGNGNAVLSGGRHYKGGWEVDDAEKGIYKLKVDEDINTRTMYADGMRMIRARTAEGFTKNSFVDEKRVEYVTENTEFKSFRKIEDLECVYLVLWTEPRCGVTALNDNGDGTISLVMDQPCFNTITNKQHLTAQLPRYFENQYEFIDEEGEWYLSDGYLYFKPYDFMDLESLDIVLPTTERLIGMIGSREKRAENIAFIGLDFKYTTWLYPSSSNGFSDAQGGRVRSGGDWVPQSALWVQFADNVTVEDCTFSKLGSTALNVTDWVTNVNIVGNHIYDISGCGMYVGNHGAKSEYVPNPATGWEMPAKDILIKNNYVHDYAVEFGSSDGIEGMAAINMSIENNEVHNGRYSGIVVGYGGNKGAIKSHVDVKNNYIHEALNGEVYDGGSIYVTERMATDGVYNDVSGNYVENQRNWTSCIYLDNDSSHWQLRRNVVDNRRVPLWYRNRAQEPTTPKWNSCGGQGQNLADNNFVISTPAISANGTPFASNAPDYFVPEMGPYGITYDNNTFIDSGDPITPEKQQWAADNGYVMDDVTDNIFLNNVDIPEEALEIIEKAGLEAEYLARHPENVQYLEVDRYADQHLKLGESVNLYDTLSIRGYNRKGVSADITNEKIYFTNDSPEIVSLADDGTLTSLATGKATIHVVHIKGDVVRRYPIDVYSADSLGETKVDTKELNLYLGNSAKVGATAKSKLGEVYDSDAITFKVEDESVAKVDETGVVTSVGVGKTTLHITMEVKGETREFTVPIEVRNRPSSEGFDLAEYFITDFTEMVKDPYSWTNFSPRNEVARFEGGVRLNTRYSFISHPNRYADDLLHMKLKVTDKKSWSSFDIRVANPDVQYDKPTQYGYKVVFNNGSLSLQKRVDGVYGTINVRSFPCDFEIGKEHDFIVGAVDYEDYVEIICVLDGKLVMRYRDEYEDRLTGSGAVQVYSRQDYVIVKSPDKK